MHAAVTFNITLSGYNSTTFDAAAQQHFLDLIFDELSNDLPHSIESAADIHLVFITSITQVHGGVLVTITVKARATAEAAIKDDLTSNSSRILPYDPYGNVKVWTSGETTFSITLLLPFPSQVL